MSFKFTLVPCLPNPMGVIRSISGACSSLEWPTPWCVPNGRVPGIQDFMPQSGKYQANWDKSVTWCTHSLYHSPDALTLGNTKLLKETASKFAQPLLQKETLSLLSWTTNKSALWLRERHYLYLLKLFAIQTYLKRYSRIEAANVSAQMCRNARDLKEIVSQ